MIVTHCVIGILGALAGTYPAPTLTLFEWDIKANYDSIVASVARDETYDINARHISLSDYVLHSAQITGEGNVYQICPSTLTKENCALVKSKETSRLYRSCLRYFRKDKRVIIFPPLRTTRRNLLTSYNEAANRNMKKLNKLCLKILKEKFSSLLNQPTECTNVILRDLIYGAEVKLNGWFGCEGNTSRPTVFLTANKPMEMELDAPHRVYASSEGFFFFTTDGSHILRFNAKFSDENFSIMYWNIKRGSENYKLKGLHDLILQNRLGRKIFDFVGELHKPLDVKFEKCPEIPETE